MLRYCKISFLLILWPSISHSDHMNDWLYYERTESLGIREAWEPAGILERLKLRVFGHYGGHDLFVSCNTDGTLDFSIQPMLENQERVSRLFDQVDWQDRADSYRGFPAAFLVEGFSSMNIDAQALINDDLDRESIWIFAEYLPQIPLLEILSSNEFSVTIQGPKGSDTFDFKPNFSISALREFQDSCG